MTYMCYALCDPDPLDEEWDDMDVDQIAALEQQQQGVIQTCNSHGQRSPAHTGAQTIAAVNVRSRQGYTCALVTHSLALPAGMSLRSRRILVLLKSTVLVPM